MSLTDVAESAQRAASAVQHSGMAMSVGGGASVAVTEYMGLSTSNFTGGVLRVAVQYVEFTAPA